MDFFSRAGRPGSGMDFFRGAGRQGVEDGFFFAGGRGGDLFFAEQLEGSHFTAFYNGF